MSPGDFACQPVKIFSGRASTTLFVTKILSDTGLTLKKSVPSQFDLSTTLAGFVIGE